MYWSEKPLIKAFGPFRLQAEVTSMAFVPALNVPVTVEPVEINARGPGVKFVAVSYLPKVDPIVLPCAFVPAAANSLVKVAGMVTLYVRVPGVVKAILAPALAE